MSICPECQKDCDYFVSGLCPCCAAELIKQLSEDIKRCGENWKALYCELKTKLERVTEAWKAEIKDKEDSVFIGEIHCRFPKKTK